MKNTTLTTTLLDYYTKTSIDNTLLNYYTKTIIDTKLLDYTNAINTISNTIYQ